MRHDSGWSDSLWKIMSGLYALLEEGADAVH
jgi:hypothetical protein